MIKVIDDSIFTQLCKDATESPRKRAHHLIHHSSEDKVQRIAMVMHRGSYVRPHRHINPAITELFCIHAGAAVAITFDDSGSVTERIELRAGGPVYIIEFEAGCWHVLAALQDNTLLSEYKPGPFTPNHPNNLASWAPTEGASNCDLFTDWFTQCQVGDKPPGT